MWIVGAVTTVTVLAPSLGSGAMEPTVDAVDLNPFVSYIHAQEVPESRIWLDRGVDPVLETGDRVRIYYRTDADAYVAILQIDTDGTTRMLYPRSPTENHYARAGRDYRLLFPRSAYWNVDDRPGVGYFFIVTSPTPFDLSDFRYSYYEGGWDLSAVGSTVYSDPYVAMDDFVARLVPDWEYVDYGLDFISYRVGGAHEYPRFLCYQCHGFRPYDTWNPYRYTCVDFRVVVYDDPYFYPSRRYRADRVVLVGPRNPTRPRFGFKERAAGEPGTPVRVVRQGEGDDPSTVTDRPRTDQTTGRGRVASPPVVPPPTITRRRDLSGRDQAARLRSDGGRVTSPPAGNPEARRPTLQRRPAAPSQGTGPRSEAPRPSHPGIRQRGGSSSDAGRARPEVRNTPRPSADQPRPGPQRPSTRPSTRRSPQPSSRSAAPPQRRLPPLARPSTRRPDNPPAGSSSRPPSPPSTRRPPPPPSSGSSSARPAPRAGPRTPPANGGATRPPSRRRPGNGTR